LHAFLTVVFTIVNFSPGEKRKTKEEQDFADFDIFDDPNTPYSTFNFTYTHNDFKRLSHLTEFNTLTSLEHIKCVLTDVIERKRHRAPRVHVNSREIKLLRMQSIKKVRGNNYSVFGFDFCFWRILFH
jgi:phospholipase A2